MVNSFINILKNLDNSITTILKYGLRISLFICLLSIFLLITYKSNPISLDLYYNSLSLFKGGLMLGVAFTICSIIFDTILKKDIRN